MIRPRTIVYIKFFLLFQQYLYQSFTNGSSSFRNPSFIKKNCYSNYQKYVCNNSYNKFKSNTVISNSNNYISYRKTSNIRDKIPLISFKDVLSTLSLYQNEQKIFQEYFTKIFEINHLALIYPSNLQEYRKLKRGVLGAVLKTGKKQVAIKMENLKEVRAKYDHKDRIVKCSNDHNFVGEPAESFFARLTNNTPHFIKFHSISKQFNFRNGFNMYVYDRIKKSKDLKDWTIDQPKNNKNEFYHFEIKLGYFLLQIHEALVKLFDKGFVYTDFKPMNVLVDEENNKAYLIDLESFISSKSHNICISTAAFLPPDFENRKLKNLNENTLENDYFNDRMLSWTFCYSIFSLTCLKKPDDVFNINLKKNITYWTNQYFTQIFKSCNIYASQYLLYLLNICLVRKQEKYIFKNLNKQSWFHLYSTLHNSKKNY